MLLSLCFLIAPSFLWYEVQRCFFPKISTAERAAASTVVGIVSSCWTVLWDMTLFGPDNDHEPSLSSIQLIRSILLHLVGLFLVSRFHPKGLMQIDAQHTMGASPLTADVSADSAPSVIAFSSGNTSALIPNEAYIPAVPAALVLAYIFHTHMLPEDEYGNLLTGGNCYSDLPYHLTITNSFLYGYNSRLFSLFSMSNPVFYNDRLQYPIIPDFLTAVCIRGGFSTRYALLIPSVMVSTSFCILLFSFAYRFSRFSHLPHPVPGITATLALYLTIFCGGDYEFKEPHFWLFFVKDIFLPQRSAMFGYTLILYSTIVTWIAFEEQNETRTRWKYLEWASFVAACSPYVQAHTFIAFFILSGLQLLMERFDLKNPLSVSFIQDCAFLLGPAVFFGIPQMASFAGGAASWGFAQVTPMWTERKNVGFLSWIWECVGFHVILLIVAWRFIHPTQRKRVLPFLGLFFVCMFVKFQPWNVDNMKIFYIAFFGLISAIASFLSFLTKQHHSYKLLVLAVFMLLSIPGMVVVKKEVQENFPLLSKHEIEAAEWVRDNTPYDSLFMLASPPPRHKNTIPTWGGRSVIMGFKGWLQSRDLLYDMQERWTRKLVKGDPEALDICRHYGINYVEVAGKRMRDEWVEGAPVNRTWIHENLKLVYEGKHNVVYELRMQGSHLEKQIFGPLYHITYRRAWNQ